MSFSYNKTYQNDKFHRIHEMGMRLLLLVCRIRPHVVFPVASSNTLLALGVVAELSLPPSLHPSSSPQLLMLLMVMMMQFWL